MGVKLNGCGQATRVIFILINILFLLLGVGLLVGGSYLVSTGNHLALFTGSNVVGGAALLIIAGIITFLIAASGIIGAIFLLRIVLGVYIVVVSIVIALELIAGILGIVYRSKLEKSADTYISATIDKYINNDTQAIKVIDLLQISFRCCGWNASSDWDKRPEGVPDSCECIGSYNPDICNDSEMIWKLGCKSGVLTAVRSLTIGIGVAGIFFAVIEVIIVLMAIGLCACITRGNEGYSTV